ncbi:MAG: hypothetical protein K5695_15365 [Oscillospiraceae bacterium]|nr:hypothetical protein [Oscillospiraceae bacterium]
MKTSITKSIAMALAAAFLLTGCGERAETLPEIRTVAAVPPIVFIERIDNSYLLGDMSPGEIGAQKPVVMSLRFYDCEGALYTCVDEDVNAMDNGTLAAAYEAGALTGKLHYVSTCDTADLAAQYRRLVPLYQEGRFTFEEPMELPAVEAGTSAWYGYYYDKAGALTYMCIQKNKCMTNIYTDNDTVNEVCDWLNETSRKK